MNDRKETVETESPTRSKGMVRCQGDPFVVINQLRAQGRSFQHISTTNSSTLKIPGEPSMMFSDTVMGKKYLHLFTAARKEVLHNLDYNIQTPTPKMEGKNLYNRFCDRFDAMGVGEIVTLHNVVELDIVKAYYNAALLLGYIGEDFYNKCIAVPKHVRLALIGSIATVKTTEHYVDGVLVDITTSDKDPERRTAELRAAWFHIVNYVDNCLYYFSKISEGKFIMYWVDGIYLEYHDNLHIDTAIVQHHYGLEFSEEPLDSVVVTCTKEGLVQFDINKSEKESTKFYKRTAGVPVPTM